MSLPLTIPTKRVDISLRRDTNATTTAVLRTRKDVNNQEAGLIKFNKAFNVFNNFSAGSIYDFCRKIMYDWFPQNNFTAQDVSGNLRINGENVGGVEFVVVGSQTVESSNVNSFFTDSKDVNSSFIFVKGNLTIQNGVTLTPPTRKLFTVLYVSGDLTFGGDTAAISMSQRGANHSGTGDSGGYVAPVDIKVGTNTVIASLGGAGAAENTVDGTARIGLNGSTTQSTLGTGGGGGGWNDTSPAL